MYPKIYNFTVYLLDGTIERVKNAWVGIQSSEERTVFFDVDGEVKAVYMDCVVSRFVRDDP